MAKSSTKKKQDSPNKDHEAAKVELVKGKLSLTRDPRVYADSLPALRRPYKRLLGLDLASSAGAAFADIIPGQPPVDSPIIGGQWDLGVSNHDTNSIRYVRLKQFLCLTSPDLVFYEEVKHVGQNNPAGMHKQNLTALVARAVTGAQVVQGLCAILVTWCEEHDVPCEAIPVGTLKRFATGKGNSNKTAMIHACNEQFSTDFAAEDYESTGADNIADSMFLCALAVEHYSEGL